MIHNGQRVPRAESSWLPMSSAPRDGTVVELRNSFGIAPWYGLFRWIADDIRPSWRSAADPRSGIADCVSDFQLAWRPTTQSPDEYVDPTNGAQDTRDYWVRASGSHE